MQGIPIQYVHQEVRYVNPDDSRPEYMFRFKNIEEAQKCAKTMGGVVITEQTGGYWVFPKSIEGYVGQVVYKEQD